MISENDVEIIANSVEKKREEKRVEKNKKIDAKFFPFIAGFAVLECFAFLGLSFVSMTTVPGGSVISFILGLFCAGSAIYLFEHPERDLENEEKKKDREILRALGDKTKIIKQNP